VSVPHIDFLRCFLGGLDIILIFIIFKIFIVFIKVFPVQVGRGGTPQTFVDIKTTAEISMEINFITVTEPNLGNRMLGQEPVEFIFAHEAANVDLLVRLVATRQQLREVSGPKLNTKKSLHCKCDRFALEAPALPGQLQILVHRIFE